MRIQIFQSFYPEDIVSKVNEYIKNNGLTDETCKIEYVTTPTHKNGEISYSVIIKDIKNEGGNRNGRC